MIKVTISRGTTSIHLESDEPILQAALTEAYALFQEMSNRDTQQPIPFKEVVVPVSAVEVPETGFELTEEEFDAIERIKARGKEQTDKDKAEIRAAIEASAAIEAAERAAAEKAAAEKAEEKRIMLEKAMKENEERAERAEARKKRAALRRLEVMETGEVTDKMSEETAADKAEADQDALAQAEFDATYGSEVPAIEPKKEEPKKEEPKKEEQPTKAQQQAPAKNQQQETPAKPEVTVVEEEEGDEIAKIVKIFALQEKQNTDLSKAVTKAMGIMTGAGFSKTEAAATIVKEVVQKESAWALMLRRKTPFKNAFKLSDAELNEVEELLKQK